MSIDPKRLVESGYDIVAEEYAAWADRIVSSARERWTAFLLDALPEGAAVLDLGCGHGLPSTRVLAERFAVTGVDISSRQIELARRNVPGGTFMKAEMTALDFAQNSFDAVTAFYSIIHVPRDEQPMLFQSIAGWLKPGGYLVAVMGSADSPGAVDENWLGAPMYWSHYPAETNVAMAMSAGFEIVSSESETIFEDGEPVTFQWLVARSLDS
jgi:SAM-dependent methyltransferase